MTKRAPRTFHFYHIISYELESSERFDQGAAFPPPSDASTQFDFETPSSKGKSIVDASSVLEEN